MNEQPTMGQQSTGNDQPEQKRRTRIGGGGFTFALLLIFAGSILLLNTSGVLPWIVWERIWPLWPVVLILIGLDILLSRYSNVLRLGLAVVVLIVLAAAVFYLITTTESAEVLRPSERTWPLEGIDRGTVRLHLGVGELSLDALEDPDAFAQVLLQGREGVRFEQHFERTGTAALLEISGPERSAPWPFRTDRNVRWEIALSPQIPLDMEINLGVGQSQVDLQHLQVDDLQLNTGVGEVQVTLPAQVERGDVHIQTGVGQVTVIIPGGVAAQIEVESALVSVDVDQSRFPKRDGTYRSPDYDTAPYRLDLRISGAIGEIEIRSGE